MPATDVARALIDGVRKGRSQITADSMTAALTVAGSTLEPAVRASMTRTIRRAMDR